MRTKTFVPWMGWLRVLAMLMVCLCHAVDPLSAFGAPDEKIWAQLYGSFVRPCVPLFVMLTGALLLPTEEDFGGIFRKRIVRVILPFLVWTGVYASIPAVLHLCGISVETIQRVFFPWAAPLHVDAPGIVRTFFLSLLQFNQYAVQLWYIYLLVGLYLFMPVLSAWLRTATTKAKITFLALWGGSLLVWYWPVILELLITHSQLCAAFFSDYVVRFLGSSELNLAHTVSFEQYPILGVCEWNGFGMFHCFSGFVGYLVLGHLLKEVKLTLKQTLLIALPALLVGYAIILGGTHWMWGREGCTLRAMEYFWWYCSPAVALMSAGCFLLIKHINWAPAPILALLKHFSRVGFGVFCAHYVLVTGTFYLLSPILPAPLIVPLAALIGMSITWALIALLCRLPGTQRYLG